MHISLNQRLHRLQLRLGDLCEHRHFDWLMAALFFSEAIFFPIPIDPLLILACLKKPYKSLYYGTIATIASVVGGVTAYWIGALLWNNLGLTLINVFTSPENFNAACFNLEAYEAWAVLIAGFTPFPYKVMALVTGFCQVSLGQFIIFSILSRAARFMLIAALAKRYGLKVQNYLDRYGTILIGLFILISVMSYSCLK